jgi:GTPase SAR1 family protein
MTDISITGNVEGNIVVGDNNFVVNNNHGTIIQQQAAPPVQKKNVSPQPPRKPRSFVGRKRELDEVDGLIASRTPVIVHGMDGIGKTSLLKQAANSESARSQPDGVIFLEGLDESGKLLEFGDLTQRLFKSLFDTQPGELKVDHASARTYLSNTQPLVLLNSISLPASDLDKLADLFPKAPILIATEGTAQPEAYESILLGPLAREDSLTLLANSTSVDDQETLSKLAALLENVPAALITVANAIRQKDLKVDDAFARLQSYTPVEKDKTKAALERAFALMFSTLTEEERGMLIQTAAAPGISINRKWLENVCGGSAVSEKLESMELLQVNSPRFRLMPGLRSFLLRGQDVSKERERLLSYLLAELETRWKDFEFIKDELGNLLGLLAWAVAQGQWMHVATLGRAIDPYLTLNGLWDAWKKTLDGIQRAAGSMQNLALQGWVLHQMGTYEVGMGNLGVARNLLEQAVKIRTQLGDQVGAAYSQHNLQVIAPVVPPTTRPANLTPWVLGGLAVIAIAAFLIFGNPPRNTAPPTVEPTIVAVSEVPVVASHSPTPTVTSTLTETPSPSATITATFTPSSTGMPTVTPTYAVLSKVVVNDVAACFHGPGNVYLNKGTRRIAGNTVDLLGRIETDKGIWVYTRFSLPRTDASDPCWMDAKYLDITQAELMSVAPFDPTDPHKYLPLGAYYPDHPASWPIIQSVLRRGANTVIVSWSFYDVPEADRENARSARYLIEAWVCKAGKIVFQPIGVFFPTEGPYNPTASINITDEAGCSEPSHARLYLSWIDAYAGPVEIEPWPQSETVLPIPTSTP